MKPKRSIYLWAFGIPLALWIIMLLEPNLNSQEFYYNEIYRQAEAPPRIYYNINDGDLKNWSLDNLRPKDFDYFFSRFIYLFLVGQTIWLVYKKDLGFFKLHMIIFYSSILVGTIPYILVENLFHLQVTGIYPLLLWIVNVSLMYQLGLGIYVRMIRTKQPSSILNLT